MITSYSRGHKIEYINNKWIYFDNKQLFDDSRPCKRCGRMPDKDGYDACLGHIQGITAACCGHGVGPPYVI
jgi:hypothetical protein